MHLCELGYFGVNSFSLGRLQDNINQLLMCMWNLCTITLANSAFQSSSWVESELMEPLEWETRILQTSVFLDLTSAIVHSNHWVEWE